MPSIRLFAVLMILSFLALSTHLTGCSGPNSPTTPNSSGGGAPTSTPTVTATRTGIPTGSATPTITATLTLTSTPTLTRTATPTSTSTVTPVNSPTFTPTSTPTQTSTFTATSTSSVTPVDTATFSPTSTPTQTSTFTTTSTLTESPTLTQTPTASDTPTITDTPTNSPSPTITDTPTATLTPTVTPTVTSTNTVTTTFTPAPHPFITAWGSSSTDYLGANTFRGPLGLAIDSINSLVYVCDTEDGFLQRFSESGTYQTQFTGAQPNEAVVDASGNIFIADGANYRVLELNSAGATVTSWDNWTGGGSGYFNSGSPFGMAMNHSGPATLFVTNPGNIEIDAFTTSGTFIRAINSQPLGGPQGIAVDNAGNLWVSDNGYYGTHLLKYAPGASSASLTITSLNGVALANPEGIGIDPSGNIYLADYHNKSVVEMDSTGAYTYTFPPTFHQPFDVKSDSSGNIYVDDASSAAYAVYKYGP